jgi:hypothetical protein
MSGKNRNDTIFSTKAPQMRKYTKGGTVAKTYGAPLVETQKN